MVKYTLSIITCFGVSLMPMAFADKPAPSIELLEYLADLENSENQWIDPLQMKELSENKIDEPTKEKGNE